MLRSISNFLGNGFVSFFKTCVHQVSHVIVLSGEFWWNLVHWQAVLQLFRGKLGNGYIAHIRNFHRVFQHFWVFWKKFRHFLGTFHVKFAVVRIPSFGIVSSFLSSDAEHHVLYHLIFFENKVNVICHHHGNI